MGQRRSIMAVLVVVMWAASAGGSGAERVLPQGKAGQRSVGSDEATALYGKFFGSLSVSKACHKVFRLNALSSAPPGAACPIDD